MDVMSSEVEKTISKLQKDTQKLIQDMFKIFEITPTQQNAMKQLMAMSYFDGSLDGYRQAGQNIIDSFAPEVQQDNKGAKESFPDLVSKLKKESDK